MASSTPTPPPTRLPPESLGDASESRSDGELQVFDDPGPPWLEFGDAAKAWRIYGADEPNGVFGSPGLGPEHPLRRLHEGRNGVLHHRALRAAGRQVSG